MNWNCSKTNLFVSELVMHLPLVRSLTFYARGFD